MWIARVWHCSLFVISRCAEFKHKTEGLYPLMEDESGSVPSVLPDSRRKTDNSPWHSAVHSPLSGCHKGEWVLPESEMDDGRSRGQAATVNGSQPTMPSTVRWAVQGCHPVQPSMNQCPSSHTHGQLLDEWHGFLTVCCLRYNKATLAYRYNGIIE